MKDIWQGKWKQLKGEVQKQWGNLTENDLEKIDGDRTKLEGLIQEKYGIEKQDLKDQLDAIEKKYQD